MVLERGDGSCDLREEEDAVGKKRVFFLSSVYIFTFLN